LGKYSPQQSIRRRRAAPGTADSLSAPAQSAGFLVTVTAAYQTSIGSERGLTAARRQAAGGPACGFAAVLARTVTISRVEMPSGRSSGWWRHATERIET